MQAWTTDGTRQERTGWRDDRISQRHRDWGFNCPAVDLDFLMVEYNLGLPVGLIEYKHHAARMPSFIHPTYRAISSLADQHKLGPLPFAVAFYWPDYWAFRIHPVNDAAKKHFKGPFEVLTEAEFVARLYRIRNRTVAKEVISHLQNVLPPEYDTGDEEVY